MSIPVVREPAEIAAEFGSLIESCHFCKRPTRHWHEETNNPVCPGCAERHEASELPNWRKNASTGQEV